MSPFECLEDVFLNQAARMKRDRHFFPVGGTGGGAVPTPYCEELWFFLISTCFREEVEPVIGLLTTASTLSPPGLSGEDILESHQALGLELGCTFLLLEEKGFGKGHYDDRIDLICVTCGNTAAALAEWKRYGCEVKLRELYDAGIPITGYSAGFIAFFEYASTDSVPGPADCRFGVMKGLGFLPGGAVPHADTQAERIPDFQEALQKQPISPVLVLGEEVMAHFANERFVRALSPVEEPLAGWLQVEGMQEIEVLALSPLSGDEKTLEDSLD